ncbi:hypothetical protein BKA62DRAFT_481605 [Auriculariales sp. MPI-PUGE-AT-0066]|nr:hypothetical protein BKA62DRAFT_481605 [Auriculariales sp. MPI-PUGE-AT-0066]
MHQPTLPSLDPQHLAPPGSAVQNSRRHAKHVSRACNGCRRRKSKCDGVHPVCDTCTLLQHDCTWTAEEDGRRPATKAQIVSMTMEIRALKEERDRHEAIISRLRDEVRLLGGTPGQMVHGGDPNAERRAGSALEGAHAQDQTLGIVSSDFFVSPEAANAFGGTFGDLPSDPSSALKTPSSGFAPASGEQVLVGSDDESSTIITDSHQDKVVESILLPGPLGPFLSTGKRLAVFEDDDEIGAVYGTSPLAFSTGSSIKRMRTSRNEIINTSTVGLGPTLETGPGFNRQDPMGTSTSVFSIHEPANSEPIIPAAGHDKDCPCDWARFLPAALFPATTSVILFGGQRQAAPNSAVLTRKEHDEMLEEYFTHVASWQMRIVPRLFLRDMRATLVSTPRVAGEEDQRRKNVTHYSASLHCAILAEAGACAPSDSILAQQSTRDLLAKTAREYAEAECKTPRSRALPTILALSVLAQYHLGTQHGARHAYSLFGMAVRLALCAGLNLDARSLLDDMHADAADVAEEVWAREWCWRALFVQDVDMALHAGQELSMVPPGDPTVSFAQQGDFLVGETFSRTVRLMCIAARVMALLGSRSSKPSASIVSAVQTELALWQADLPDALRVHRESTSHAFGHVLVLHMTAQWVTILLHRPFYVGGHSTEMSRKCLDDACNKLLRALGTYQRLYGLSCSTPLSVVQIAFVAGAAALLRVDSPSPMSAQKKKRGEALASAKQAIDALRELAQRYPCAAGYADALERRSDAVREHVARLVALELERSHGHGPPTRPTGLSPIGRERASSTVSVGSASVSSMSASSMSISSAYSSPSPTTESGPPSIHGAQRLPAVVIRSASGDDGSQVTRMDLDAQTTDAAGLFGLYGGTQVADVQSYGGSDSEVWPPLESAAPNPFGFDIPTDFTMLQQQMFGSSGGSSSSSMPNPDLGVFMAGHVSSDDVTALGFVPFTHFGAQQQLSVDSSSSSRSRSQSSSGQSPQTSPTQQNWDARIWSQ